MATKTIYFKRIVKKKVRTAAFEYLVKKIKSKGKKIKYKSDFECQAYLKPNKMLTLQEQRTIFSFRARMNNLSYNFQGNNQIEYCQCGKEMTNCHLYECKIFNQSDRRIPYNNIFEGRICEMKYIINILIENQNKFEVFTLAQSIRSSIR